MPGAETAGSQDRIEAMTNTQSRIEAEKMSESFKKYRSNELQVIGCLDRLISSSTLDDKDLRQAVYYLTDEAYANERHTILFFANKL